MGPHLAAAGIEVGAAETEARVLAHFDVAEVIELDGAPAGLIKVLRTPAAWRLQQLQLLPAHQGRGLGARLVQALVDDARAADAALSLSVLRANPARRLYERLGFVVVAEDDFGFEMRVLPPPLFEAADCSARELGPAEVPLLQALFDANPAYFLTVNGRRPHADEAQTEFDELPPPHLGFTRRWFAGLFHRDRGLEGIAIVVSDLSAPGVWHLALFLLATARHGHGEAPALFAALEAWAARHGASWLRLGVVQGNARAERFWARRGFTEVRVRAGVDTGGRINTVRVLVKPLAGGTLAAYLDAVPRDRPGSTLP
jgi:GNAT superfamily N-acetyltransferase